MSSNNHGAIPSIVSAHFGCFLPCIFPSKSFIGPASIWFSIMYNPKEDKT